MPSIASKIPGAGHLRLCHTIGYHPQEYERHPVNGATSMRKSPSRRIKDMIRAIPIVGPISQAGYAALRARIVAKAEFPGSREYWERRYSHGGNSGAGSYDKFMTFKAQVINDFVANNGVNSVIEFGCGDGNQLEVAEYPRYLGLDVSETAIRNCRERFADDVSKSFELLDDYVGDTADLCISLDVLYHLIEDDIYDAHMRALFGNATRFVIIYSCDLDEVDFSVASHVKPRKFTRWIEANAPEWSLLKHVPNPYPYDGDEKSGSWSDFYIYKKM
jgi:SAM-dependent methyltransferase